MTLFSIFVPYRGEPMILPWEGPPQPGSIEFKIGNRRLTEILSPATLIICCPWFFRPDAMDILHPSDRRRPWTPGRGHSRKPPVKPLFVVKYVAIFLYVSKSELCLSLIAAYDSHSGRIGMDPRGSIFRASSFSNMEIPAMNWSIADGWNNRMPENRFERLKRVFSPVISR